MKHNIKVGPRLNGGYEGELDVVVFDPVRQKILHFEPSTDANSWEERRKTYEKKFRLGRSYICSTVFPWLPNDIEIEHIAIFFSVKGGEMDFLNGRALSIDYLIKTIRTEIQNEGPLSKKAIPEKYPILRSIQLVLCGYTKVLPD